MTRQAESADLLLLGGHGRRLPRWLANFMMRLGVLMASVVAARAGNNRSRKAR